MAHDIVEICRSYPQIVVFLAIAIGYFVGKMKFHGFNIGSTAGVLIVALVLGQMNIKVSPLLKAVSFALFIFCMGYKVGPQFFGALKKEGLDYIWLSLLVALSGLVIAILLGKVFGFDKGITAGLLAGSMTQSSVIGTAEGAIKHLSISAAEQTALEGNVAVAYAITYVFGTAGLIFFFKMLPRLMKIDLRNEARRLEEQMSGGSGEIDRKPELFSWYKQLNIRAYRVTNEKILGKTVSELEALFPGKVAVEKLKRADGVIDPRPGTIIQWGDVLAIVGDRSEFFKADVKIGPEVDDRGVVGLIGEILSICVLNREAVGKTLGEISSEHGHACFLRKITRQGHELPLTKNTVVHKCDVLEVAGAQKDVERLVKHLGYPERPTVITDLVIVGLGCVLGTLLGLIMVPVLGYSVPFAFGNVLLTIWGTVLVNVM